MDEEEVIILPDGTEVEATYVTPKFMRQGNRSDLADYLKGAHRFVFEDDKGRILSTAADSATIVHRDGL